MTQPEFIAPPESEQTDAAEQTDGHDDTAPPSLSEEEMRSELRRARREAAKYRTEARDLATKVQSFEDQNKSEIEKANEATTRWQSEAETWRNAAVGSTVRALAATDFADPDDAVNALDPQSYLDAGGQINEQAIKADLAKLLDAKPHYRRTDGPTSPRVPAPNPSQGSGVNGRSAPDPANEFAAILQGQLK